MYQKIDLNDFLKTVIKRIKDETGLKCYDAVPQNAKSPFYFAEITRTRPADTKTTYRDVISVNIHAIAKPSNSSVEINSLIQEVREALSMDIVLPEPFYLALQVDNGVQSIYRDETKEKHAVMAYDFTISYGLKCK